MKNKIAIPIIDRINTLESLTTSGIPEFAKNDLNVSLVFLNQYTGNKATFDSYRREIERLLQWSWHIEKKSILELKRQDIENYISFCLNPSKSWIGTNRVSRFVERNGVRIANPKWRP